MGDSSIEKFTILLYDIYQKTCKHKDVSENNCRVSQQFLELSKEEQYVQIEDTSSTKKKNDVYPTSAPAPDTLVNEIQKVIDKAKATRLSSAPDLKLPSPYIASLNDRLKKKAILSKTYTLKCNPRKAPVCNTHPEKSISNVGIFVKRAKVPSKHSTPAGETKKVSHYPEQRSGRSVIARSKLNEITEILKSLDHPIESTSFVSHSDNMRTQPGNTNLGKNSVHNSIRKNNKKLNDSKSNVSLRSEKSNVRMVPASLHELRLPSDIQKILRSYYRFINEKDMGVANKKAKIKNEFLTKLTLINSHRWRVFQGDGESIPFCLQNYIKSYSSYKFAQLPRPVLCKYYDNVKVLMSIQNSTSDKERNNMFREIFKFMNTEFLRYVQSSECDKQLVPIVYKCVSYILNMYNSGNFKNSVVLMQ